MNKNLKNYKSYKSFDSNDEDITDYPRDSYVKPGSDSKVGKLDEYNKEKSSFNKTKSKVVLKESNIPAYSKEKSLDDLVPSQIGDAIDNVFSTVDNLLNVTGKLFFGGKSSKRNQPQPRPQPVRQVNSQPKQDPKIVTSTPQVNNPPVHNVSSPAPKPSASSSTVIKQNPKPVQQTTTRTSNVKGSSKSKSLIDDDVDNSPPVTRTTSISELELPMDILSDPDIVKYFDQMKLYEKKVNGGLCSLSFRKAEEILKKGRWGKLFMISYNQLKINTMMASADAGEIRFMGMSPVYKALGRNFKNTDDLRKAIENDINLYLKNGEGSGEFHKFTYKVHRKK